MLYKNRSRFEKISIKVGILFGKIGLSPNQWTFLTLLPALLSLYFLVNEKFLLASLLFITAGFFDLVDGSVARVTGRVTKKGAYLDTIMDRYVEGLLILGLLFVSLPYFIVPAYVWLFLFMLGSFTTTYAKSAAKEKDLVDKEIKGGLFERAERLILLFLGILLASVSKMYLVYIIVLLALLTNITALQRIISVLAKEKK